MQAVTATCNKENEAPHSPSEIVSDGSEYESEDDDNAYCEGVEHSNKVFREEENRQRAAGKGRNSHAANRTEQEQPGEHPGEQPEDATAVQDACVMLALFNASLDRMDVSKLMALTHSYRRVKGELNKGLKRLLEFMAKVEKARTRKRDNAYKLRLKNNEVKPKAMPKAQAKAKAGRGSKGGSRKNRHK